MFFGNAKLEQELVQKDALVVKLQSEVKSLKEQHKKELASLKKEMENLESQYKSLQKEHKEYVDKVEASTTIDIVSGAKNKRYFYDMVEGMLLLSKRDKWKVSLAVINVPEYDSLVCEESKLHQALQTLVHRISGQIRESDIFVRLEKAKFLIAFPKTSLEQAKLVCEKLKNVTAQSPVFEETYCSLHTGTATFGENENINIVLKRAEESMQ
ncbi:MAG: diguanylate cyclase [Campylobacterales bacterium]|nr:diguanylate cyclase [Campylobacterales bacterium]